MNAVMRRLGDDHVNLAKLLDYVAAQAEFGPSPAARYDALHKHL